jgi:nitrogenase molybdenum-iron protein alpha/beta subunit
MLDCHFYTSNKYISIAAEPDLLFSLSYFLVEEMGSKLETAITTNSSDIIESIPTPNVYVGDLDDLEKEMKKSELIISNTNGLIASKKSEVPIYFAGFPVKNRFGYHLKNFIGYKGTREFLFDITNIFFEREEEKSFMKIV